MKKFLIDYTTFLSGSKSLASTLGKVDLVLALPRGGLSFAHILSLSCGCGCKMIDLESTNTELRKYIEKAVTGCTHVVIADDSIGTGVTFSRIKQLMDVMPVTWEYAVFYVDGSFKIEDNRIRCVMQTNQWVVLPYEEAELIEVGDQSSLFRNGNDPYQRRN